MRTGLILATVLPLISLAGCGVIENIDRTMRSLGTTVNAPSEGTDDATALHAELARRPDATAARAKVTALQRVAVDLVSAQVGSPTVSLPAEGLRTVACTEPYSLLQGVHAAEVTTVWNAAGRLEQPVRDGLWQSVHTEWRARGLTDDLSGQPLTLSEGKPVRTAQFYASMSFYDDTTAPLTTRISVRTYSGCVRD